MPYIGIIERNDNEGEEFGYYFQDNPDLRDYLEKINELMPEDMVGEGYGQFEIVLQPIEEEDLMAMARMDDNLYMRRVNVYRMEDQPWDEIIESDFDEDIPFYKGNCFSDPLDMFYDQDDQENEEDTGFGFDPFGEEDNIL